ncbi:MAG: hypothetical protein ABIW47_12735 [Ginsengibacter sp.]
MATIKKTQTAGKKTAFPKSIKSMLATLVKEPFNNDEWIYEVKLDGYRALAFLNNGQVYIQSRNEKSFDEKFYAIHMELEKWKINAVVDGEIIVADKEGMADFGQLQNSFQAINDHSRQVPSESNTMKNKFQCFQLQSTNRSILSGSDFALQPVYQR